MQATGMVLRTFVQRCGGSLALAALALQLALSFGHIHARDIFGRNSAYSSFHAAGGWRRPAQPEASTQRPWKLADDDDHCPICFSTFLLGTSFIPDASQPLQPSQFADVGRLTALAFNGLGQPQRGPFQSRAPPLAGQS